ncbi:MAG: acyl-CoA dehydratase activase, partial [Nitrospirota bacterium]
AVARNFKGCISRGRHLIPPVTFQGGVAANKGMVRAFREVFGLDDLLIPEDFALMGAAGAALKDRRDGIMNNFDISRLEDFIKTYKPLEKGYEPLAEGLEANSNRSFGKGNDRCPVTDDLHSNHEYHEFNTNRINAYLGIDVGSISTNLAVINEEGKLLAKRYLMTAGRPIEAVKQGLAEIGEEIGDRVEILSVGTTGSGRYMIADFVGADIVKNEITAQATAAAFIDTRVDTIFEIGGQDSKFISLQNGIIVDFEMNKACAAGTGSFLEEQAEKLNISIKGEFEQRALSARNPCRLGERCTVFMENSLMANLQKGADKDDLLAGLAYSIVQNYINRVVAGKKIGDNIFFQGGVAFNRSVVSAFEKYLGKKISVPPHHDVTGAIGMALIAMREMKTKTGFKGFGLSRRPYAVSSFECKGCPNVCEINRVKIEGEKGFLFYGGRCEKYDVRKKKNAGIPDHFAFREEALWREHIKRNESGEDKTIERSESRKSQPAITIGVPYVFFFHDFLPFWTTLLHELGFAVEVSPRTNRQVVNLGLERVLAEACFPVKVAHGHIKYLLDRKVDALFLPSFINLNTAADGFVRGLGCPHTQTIPYVSKVAFQGTKVLSPVIDLRRGKGYFLKEISKAFKPYGIRKSEISAAISAAQEAQDRYKADLRARGAGIMKNLQGINLVIVGRAYNAFDSGVNLEIPKKLADLGVPSIPFDLLPLEDCRIEDDWPNMYWRSGQRILKAARIIRYNPNLYALFAGNFLCGPDSFILKYFRKEMGEKPFLHIEIDEHSADAGAITRCEAFLDSIAHRKKEAGKQKPEERVLHRPSAADHTSAYASSARRTIYIPHMSDHAFAIAAAFHYCGIDAEVLPESEKQTADIGKKFVSGKECYPCTVTTGDMVKKVLDPGFDPERSAFFMPSGTGPCRFGQYNVFHRSVLDVLGYTGVPIFSPNQDTTFYRDLGIVGKDFTMRAWKGIIAFELLNKSLHETRPYELERGSSDSMYARHVKGLYSALRSNGVGIEDILCNVRKDFERLPVSRERKPVIGVIGEIFVRSHRFSNEDLVRKIEDLGGEVW